jgi:hypothetical protein
VSSDSSYDDLRPGLHVLREAEPLERAGSITAVLQAELCTTLEQVEGVLAERAGLPQVEVTTLSTMQVLARRVARAERIVARTRERAATELEDRLTGSGAGLAVHPTTIRDRAAAVEVARLDLRAAEQAVANHAAAQPPAEEPAAPDASLTPVHAAAHIQHRPAHQAATGPSARAQRSRAVGTIVAAFGVALVLIALRVAPLWAALTPTLAASLWAMWYLGPRRQEDASGDEEASSFLAEVSASADELFGARRATRLSDEEVVLAARRDHAEEQVRMAERAWRELAGDAEVGEVEEVVRRFDPQHEDARLLAAETVGVRASEVVFHLFEQRWLAAWHELGLDAPKPEVAEGAVRDLVERVGRAVVLVGDATVRATEVARAAPAAPVVVIHGPADAAMEHG